MEPTKMRLFRNIATTKDGVINQKGVLNSPCLLALYVIVYATGERWTATQLFSVCRKYGLKNAAEINKAMIQLEQIRNKKLHTEYTKESFKAEFGRYATKAELEFTNQFVNHVNICNEHDIIVVRKLDRILNGAHVKHGPYQEVDLDVISDKVLFSDGCALLQLYVYLLLHAECKKVGRVIQEKYAMGATIWMERGEVLISQRNIAKALGCRKDTINQRLKKLIKAGLLSSRPSPLGGKTVIYKVKVSNSI